MSVAISDLGAMSVQQVLDAGYSVALEDRSGSGVTMFSTMDGREILRIVADGRLVRGKDFRTDDETSAALFDCLSLAVPSYLAALRQRAERAESSLEEAKRHIEALTAFFMDNVLWTKASEEARIFARGLPTCGKGLVEQITDAPARFAGVSG